MKLVFLRHGQSEANARGWMGGALESPLTELGRLQAEHARGELPTFDVAWSSDLSRAMETATIVLAGTLPLHTTPLLRERDMGHWATRPRKSLARQKHRLLSWTDAPDSAESQLHVARRSVAFLATLPVADTLIVAHGGVIRVVTGLLDDVPRDRIGELRVGNCEVLVRHVVAGQLQTLLESL